jgi:Uma2 family endonuclease
MNSVARITKPPKSAPIPPLQNGERLTVAEFRRRYEAMPNVKKAELINGVVYMPSPVTMRYHGDPHCSFSGWLFIYRANTAGLEAGDNATVHAVIGEHEFQPDNCLRIKEEFGGQSRIDADGYIEGRPEFLGEVSASSAHYGLNEKLIAYEENHVLEFVVWRVEDEAIDWFVLKRGKYQRLPMSNAGLYKSKVFPGLWLDAKAMIAGELAKVIDTVQKGIASPEHQRFVAKLQGKKR